MSDLVLKKQNLSESELSILLNQLNFLKEHFQVAVNTINFSDLSSTSDFYSNHYSHTLSHFIFAFSHSWLPDSDNRKFFDFLYDNFQLAIVRSLIDLNFLLQAYSSLLDYVDNSLIFFSGGLDV